MTHVPDTASQDLLARLAGIAVDSALAQARSTRHAATLSTQASYQALFAPHDALHVPLAVRFAVAARSAELHEDQALAAHYRALQAQHWLDADQRVKLEAALQHASLLTLTPVAASPQHLVALGEAGWSPEGIVTLSQIIAFISFQSRVLFGLRLLVGGPNPEARATPAGAGDWHRQAQTAQGRPAPVAFTQQPLVWEPWLAPLRSDELTANATAVLKDLGLLGSDYFQLLARDLPILKERTLTDRGIFFTHAGLPRAERELAATVTSKVNGCIFCASVHASRATQLAKRGDDVQRLLDVHPGEPLTSGQEPLWAAQIDFAAHLAATPIALTPAHVQVLEAQGLDTLQLLDVVQSVAFFSWANRLMLTLGEPFWPEQ